MPPATSAMIDINVWKALALVLLVAVPRLDFMVLRVAETARNLLVLLHLIDKFIGQEALVRQPLVIEARHRDTLAG